MCGRVGDNNVRCPFSDQPGRMLLLLLGPEGGAEAPAGPFSQPRTLAQSRGKTQTSAATAAGGKADGSRLLAIRHMHTVHACGRRRRFALARGPLVDQTHKTPKGNKNTLKIEQLPFKKFGAVKEFCACIWK